MHAMHYSTLNDGYMLDAQHSLFLHVSHNNFVSPLIYTHEETMVKEIV